MRRAGEGRAGHYELFGVRVESELPLRLAASVPAGAPELRLRLRREPPELPLSELDGPTQLISGEDGATGSEESGVRYRRGAGSELVRFAGLGDFHLSDDLIHCQAEAWADQELLELRLVGPVLSLWLERRGLLALHGAAVAAGGRAVGLLGARGAGKSSLAAAWVAAGAELLADDLVAVDPAAPILAVRPGLPQMRMWPELARHLFGDRPLGRRVHPSVEKLSVPVGRGFGVFARQPAPLVALVLPAGRAENGEGLELEALPARQGLIEALKHSFAPRLVEAAGLAPHRLEVLARLAREVPIFRLRYPAGFDQLAATVEILARRLEAELVP